MYRSGEEKEREDSDGSEGAKNQRGGAAHGRRDTRPDSFSDASTVKDRVRPETSSRLVGRANDYATARQTYARAKQGRVQNKGSPSGNAFRMSRNFAQSAFAVEERSRKAVERTVQQAARAGDDDPDLDEQVVDAIRDSAKKAYQKASWAAKKAEKEGEKLLQKGVPTKPSSSRSSYRSSGITSSLSGQEKTSSRYRAGRSETSKAPGQIRKYTSTKKTASVNAPIRGAVSPAHPLRQSLRRSFTRSAGQTTKNSMKVIGRMVAEGVKKTAQAVATTAKTAIASNPIGWIIAGVAFLVVIVLVIFLLIVLMIVNMSPWGMVSGFLNRDSSGETMQIQYLQSVLTAETNEHISFLLTEALEVEPDATSAIEYTVDWKGVFSLFAVLAARDGEDWKAIDEADLPTLRRAFDALYDTSIQRTERNTSDAITIVYVGYLKELTFPESFALLELNESEKSSFYSIYSYDDTFWQNFLAAGLGGSAGDFYVRDPGLAAAIEAIPSGQGRQMVIKAASQLGWTYSQTRGGRVDGYADCSSLVQAAARSIGVEMPRTTRTQVPWLLERGLAISKSELRPGDLIYWSKTNEISNPYHAGIYVGNGMIIDASSSKGKVVYRQIWGTHILYARVYKE